MREVAGHAVLAVQELAVQELADAVHENDTLRDAALQVCILVYYLTISKSIALPLR